VSFWEKLLRLDRRWIFLIVATVTAIPIIRPLNLPVFVTADVRGVYDEIDKLEEGDPVLIALDYEPGSTPECDPMAEAVLIHCFRKNLRVVGVTTLPVGVGTGENVLKKIAGEMDKELGVDYTFLGFKAEQAASIVGIGISLQNTFQTDRYGNDTSELPVLAGVRKLADFAYLPVVHDDATLDNWVIYGQQLTGIRVGSLCTAVMAPGSYPFKNAGLITGIVGGLKGGSEYEKLLGIRAKASQGMDSQAVIHMFLIIIMVLGNIAYLMTRKKK
jgi:hypothetical protein